MCLKLDATSIGALIDGDDVMQRAGDDDGELGDATSDETIEDVADTDQSDEVDTEDVSDDEEYGVGWKCFPGVPKNVHFAFTEFVNKDCRGCGQVAKYTQENGARRKQVLRAKCNMCNFWFHRDCLQPVMTDATADTGCFFACSKECIEEVNENLLSDQNEVQVL
jgi:hypothetical protein